MSILIFKIWLTVLVATLALVVGEKGAADTHYIDARYLCGQGAKIGFVVFIVLTFVMIWGQF